MIPGGRKYGFGKELATARVETASKTPLDRMHIDSNQLRPVADGNVYFTVYLERKKGKDMTRCYIPR